MSRRAIGPIDGDVDDDAETVHRPGVYGSLLAWQREEKARGRFIDPRWKFHHPGEDPPPRAGCRIHCWMRWRPASR